MIRTRLFGPAHGCGVCYGISLLGQKSTMGDEMKARPVKRDC